jgi:hypothetical protein
MAKDEEPRQYEGRPLQFGDLSSEGQEVVNANMRQWGKAKTNTPIVRKKLREAASRAKETISDPNTPTAKRESAERTLKKKESAQVALRSVAPTLVNADVTLESASNRRVSLVRASARRAEAEAPQGLGGGSRLRAAGVGWYFDHRSDINKFADTHGIDQDRLLTAAAVMSPQNSPDNEKAAASALAQLHASNPTLTLSAKAKKHLKINSNTIDYASLTPEQAGKLGTPELRQHVSGVDTDVLERLAKGGTHENVAKAIHVIRGNISTDDAIDPHSSPKVWSYRDSIRRAVPNSAVHQEYLSRADNALFQIPGQQRLDLFGLKDSREGILSPTKTTAEDTWQGAISSGQQMESVPVKGSVHPVSPAKFVASEKTMTDQISKTAVIRGKKRSAIADPKIGPTALTHAWHNEATIRSAQQLSDSSGEIIPSVLPQEVGWTEGRRVAGKDDSYKNLNKSQFGGPSQGTQLSLF